MRRRAVLIVEYGVENGRPLDLEDWIIGIEESLPVQSCSVDVREDRPA